MKRDRVRNLHFTQTSINRSINISLYRNFRISTFTFVLIFIIESPKIFHEYINIW